MAAAEVFAGWLRWWRAMAVGIAAGWILTGSATAGPAAHPSDRPVGAAAQPPAAAGGAGPALSPPAGEPAGSWVLEGLVVNPYGQPVEGARVQLSEPGVQAVTGPDGRFRLTAAGTGSVRVTVRRAGYVARSELVPAGPGHPAPIRLALEVDGERFREALEEVKLRIYREGGFTPLVWFVPRLGLVARYTRPALRTPQDHLFDMFSAVVLARDALAPFPYLHEGSALVSEAVTPQEHLLRRYPRGPFLEMVAQGGADLSRAIDWTQEHYEFYRNGRSATREIPSWDEIQKSMEAVSAELFTEPEVGGTYVPGYGLVFQAVRAPQFPPVTSMTVLSMLLAVRVPLPENDRIFVQFDDGQALWALEAPVGTLRNLVKAGRDPQARLDPSGLGEFFVYRNGSPWGR